MTVLLPLAAASATTSWTANFKSPQFLAAGAAAIVALIGAFLATRSASRQVGLAREQRELEFRQAQMNELFGPLVMLRGASRNFRRLVPTTTDDGQEWRTVDHITVIQGGDHDDWRDAIVEILRINTQISELLVAKAGLFETWPPKESFRTFLAHAQQLQMSWERGENQPLEGRLPFPREFDDDIDAEVTQIRARLASLGTRGK